MTRELTNCCSSPPKIHLPIVAFEVCLQLQIFVAIRSINKNPLNAKMVWLGFEPGVDNYFELCALVS